MIPLLFKLVAARLNISNDKGPVECEDVGSIHNDIFMEVEGFSFSM